MLYSWNMDSFSQEGNLTVLIILCVFMGLEECQAETGVEILTLVQG